MIPILILVTEQVLSKLQQHGSGALADHKAVERAVDGLCIYSQLKHKWLLRREALTYLSKEQQKRLRELKGIDYSGTPPSGCECHITAAEHLGVGARQGRVRRVDVHTFD